LEDEDEAGGAASALGAGLELDQSDHATMTLYTIATCEQLFKIGKMQAIAMNPEERLPSYAWQKYTGI